MTAERDSRWQPQRAATRSGEVPCSCSCFSLWNETSRRLTFHDGPWRALCRPLHRDVRRRAPRASTPRTRIERDGARSPPIEVTRTHVRTPRIKPSLPGQRLASAAAAQDRTGRRRLQGDAGSPVHRLRTTTTPWRICAGCFGVRSLGPGLRRPIRRDERGPGPSRTERQRRMAVVRDSA
jgi:hypothetical protein